MQKIETAPSTFTIEIDAPIVAKKARAGQFVVVRVDERFTQKSRLRGAYPKIFCGKDKTLHLPVDTTCCVLRSKFDGWSLIPEDCRVVIDACAPEGTSLRLA